MMQADFGPLLLLMLEVTLLDRVPYRSSFLNLSIKFSWEAKPQSPKWSLNQVLRLVKCVALSELSLFVVSC